MTSESLYWEPSDQAAVDRKESEDEIAFMEDYLKDIEAQKDSGGHYTRQLNTALYNVHNKHENVVAAVYDFKFVTREGRWLLPRNISNRTPKDIPGLMMVRHADAGHPTLWTPKSAGIESVEDWEAVVLPFYESRLPGGGIGMASDLKDSLVLPNAASPVSRHESMKFAISITGREGPQRILDIGCSINTGLKAIALSETKDISFTELEIVNVDKARNQYMVDEKKTMLARRLLKQHGIYLEQGVGLDPYNWLSSVLFKHAWNNSFYLEELDEQDLVDQINEVTSSSPPNVDFQQADATIDYDSPLAEDLVLARQKIFGPGLSRPHFDELFDVVCLRTVLYQLDERERRIALNNAHKWVKPGGMILVQDFIDFGRGNATTVIPQSQWSGNYKTWIKDMREPGSGFVNYFSANSGRAKRLILKPAMTRLALAQQYSLVP